MDGWIYGWIIGYVDGWVDIARWWLRTWMDRNMES